MTEKITPNPYSPFADADPEYRHLIPALIFFPDPTPGALALTGCDRLAVVPEKLAEAKPGGELPDGICPDCLASMNPRREPVVAYDLHECTECDSPTRHADLCALCRQEKHDAWWAARDTETERKD